MIARDVDSEHISCLGGVGSRLSGLPKARLESLAVRTLPKLRLIVVSLYSINSFQTRAFREFRLDNQPKPRVEPL